LAADLSSDNGRSPQVCPQSAETLRPPSGVEHQPLYKSHVKAGLDEKAVFHTWDPVLSLSEEKILKEEESRSARAAGCGQRL